MAALVPLASSLAVAQDFGAVGGEFQVNTHTTDRQYVPAVGVAADGDFVVTWMSNNQDGSQYGIFAQRFASTGARQGVEFQVNSLTVNGQVQPDIAVSDGGGFVVVWSSFTGDLSLRRFDAVGAPVGVELQVESYAGSQSYPAVASDADGGAFVVVWVSYGQDGSEYGIFARRFDSSGAAQAVEFQVNTNTLYSQRYPAVAMNRGGSFVVTWVDAQEDGSYAGIFGQRFDSSGSRQAIEFQVNSYTPLAQRNPSIGIDNGGAFVVAWLAYYSGSPHPVIVGRHFDSAGVAQGPSFEVSGDTVYYNQYPSVAMSRGGDFIVAWVGFDGDYNGVAARSFDSAGTPVGPSFQVNTHVQGRQGYFPAAAVNHGDFVVTWAGDDDGSDWGIFAQRYRRLGVFDVDGNGSSDPLTDGLLALRFLFGFTGATLTTGAVDLVHCTRCDAAAIEAYLGPRI